VRALKKSLSLRNIRPKELFQGFLIRSSATIKGLFNLWRVLSVSGVDRGTAIDTPVPFNLTYPKRQAELYKLST